MGIPSNYTTQITSENINYNMIYVYLRRDNHQSILIPRKVITRIKNDECDKIYMNYLMMKLNYNDKFNKNNI